MRLASTRLSRDLYPFSGSYIHNFLPPQTKCEANSTIVCSLYNAGYADRVNGMLRSYCARRPHAVPTLVDAPSAGIRRTAALAQNLQYPRAGVR